MSQVFYCHKLKSDRFPAGFWYAHLFTHKQAVGMCGSEPIIRVSVEEDQKGDYFGWEYSDKKNFSMIYPSIKLVEICFPYGTKAEEEKGRGRVVKLKITEFPE